MRTELYPAIACGARRLLQGTRLGSTKVIEAVDHRARPETAAESPLDYLKSICWIMRYCLRAIRKARYSSAISTFDRSMNA